MLWTLTSYSSIA